MRLIRLIKKRVREFIDTLLILREESERGGIDGTDIWNGEAEHK